MAMQHRAAELYVLNCYNAVSGLVSGMTIRCRFTCGTDGCLGDWCRGMEVRLPNVSANMRFLLGTS